MSLPRFLRIGDRGLIFSAAGPQSVNFPAHAYGPLSDGRLWLNLFYLKDWGREHPLINEMRSCRAWRAVTPGGVSDAGLLATMMATADADGYPTELPAGVARCSTFILVEQGTECAPVIGGRYRVDWEGEGTVSVLGVTGVTSGANYVEFDFAPTAVNVVDVNITATTTGNHVRNMRCYKTEHASLLAAGKTVHPAFIAAWGGVKLLRWMQAQGTNEATEVNWSDDPTPTSIGRGVSISEMVDVCNELGMDGWWCIPHTASEGYVTAMATLIKNRLNPALKCYIEYTNEWWNWGPGYVGAPYFGALSDGEAWQFQEVAGAYSARAMTWWSAVFAGQMHRTVRVAGIQVNYLGLETNFLLAPNYRAAHPEFPIPHTVHDAIAGTAYMVPPYGFATARWESVIATATSNYAAGLAELKSYIFENIEQYRTWLYPHFRTVADSYGLDFLMYEGGTHIYALPGLSNMPLVRQLVADINRGPDGYDLLERMFEVWDAVGDGPFNYYVACQEPNTEGEFGAQHYINDFTQPRYQAAMEYNAGTLPANPGTPVGGQSFDLMYYLNSLFNHGAGTGTQDTYVSQWLKRLSEQAPTPNALTLGPFFGFGEQWPTPPVISGTIAAGDLQSPYVNYSPDYTNAGNIEIVGMVSDNIFGQAVNPWETNAQDFIYETEILRVIDAWEANAPNANRQYVWYAPWNYLREPGVTIPPGLLGSGVITETGKQAWYTDGLGPFQTWQELVVSRLKTARPTLDIRIHNVGKALYTVHRDLAPIHALDMSDLFFDIAHGRPAWYLMAAIAEYMCLFGEKPVGGFAIDPAWGVHPTVEANYQAIVDMMWGVLAP